MSLAVDLNADLGEGAGHDDELLELVTSANIACGFHAGDASSMRASIEAARSRDVAVGAHPSLFDRENFGRKELPVEPAEVFDAVVYQLGIFQAIAEACDVRPNHVKPHGALYNMAARDGELAHAIASAVASVDAKLIFFAPVNSALARAGEAQGLQIAHEVFADRNYCSDGSLVSRARPDALRTILLKRHPECCECCARAKSVRLMALMSMFARKRFACTVTILKQSILRELCDCSWRKRV